MARVVALSLIGSLMLGLPPAWKWQLGLIRCGTVLVAVGVATGLLAALIGDAIGAPAALELIAAILLTLILAVSLLTFRFYRDPERKPPTAGNAILSPADGEVIYVRRSAAGVLPISSKHGRTCTLRELIGSTLDSGETVVIGIAMTFLDVHVNRAPIAGRISLRKHVPGGFHSLRQRDAACTNERATTLIDGDGLQVAVVQIASRLVRQIVSFIREGDAVGAGQRIGVIRLGSQVDVVLPDRDDLGIAVEPGDRVKAGESVLAMVRSSIPHRLAT